MADVKASLSQTVPQLPHAAADPFLIALRTSCYLVVEHLFQRSRDGRVLLLDPWPPAARLTLLLDGLAFEEIRQLTAAACDRWLAKARELCDDANAPVTDAVGFDRRVQAPLLVRQGGQERLQLTAVLLFGLLVRMVIQGSSIGWWM